MSTRRASMIGVVGLLLLAVAYVALTGTSSEGMCVLGWRAMQPLVVGDTVRYIVGRGTSQSCEPSGSGEIAWSSSSDVVTVRDDGLVTAMKPGRFLLLAKKKGWAAIDGYVVPRGWRLKLDVDAEQAHVGDTIYAVAKAVDSLGRQIIPVPNSVTVREVDGRTLLRTLSSNRIWITGGASFVAVDTGTVTLVGEIKGRQTMEPLTIVPR